MTKGDLVNLLALLDITQLQLAHELNIDPANITRWRKGHRPIPESMALRMEELLRGIIVRIELADLLELRRQAAFAAAKVSDVATRPVAHINDIITGVIRRELERPREDREHCLFISGPRRRGRPPLHILPKPKLEPETE